MTGKALIPVRLRKRFRKELRRICICRASNHIEILNRELKRRSNVLGSCPNKEPLMRTTGAVLIKESHQKQSIRDIFIPKNSKESMTPEILKALIDIANGQQGLKTDLDGF